MSKIKIQGSATGTGILTIQAPTTSTDRTMTIPDSDGTLLTTTGDGSSLTGVNAVDVSATAPSSPSIGKLWYDTSESSDKLLKIYDGTVWALISSAVVGSEGNPATSVQELYDINTASGSTVWMSLSTYNSGAAFQVKYSTYLSKGWIEVLWSTATGSGTPWGNWNGSSTNTALLTHNVSSNGSMQYTGTSSSIAVGSAFNITDFAMTTKSSVGGTSVAATGQNENSAYPLTKANVMGSSTSAPITKILDYFEGSGSSVHIGDSAATSGDVYNDTDAHMRIPGNSDHYELILGRRTTTVPGVEWGVDGHYDPGSTYAPNWGYRNNPGQPYSGTWAGSWHHGTAAKTGYEVGSTNVLSLWITSM